MKIKQLLNVGLMVVAVSFSSCSDEPKETAEQIEQNKRNKELASLSALLLTEEPANVIDISDMRAKASPGDPVVFTGKVLGAKQVFLEGQAVMILGDPKKLESCDLIPGDGCKTPWDVCCDSPEEVKGAIVTVQIVDQAGNPLKTSLKGLGGIKELSTVVITGQVAKGSNKDNMIINAAGIYVKPEKKE